MSLLTIGKIVKAQGIKGEIKVAAITDCAFDFKCLKEVFIGENQRYKVEFLRVLDIFVFIKLEGVDDRNAAEALVGKYLLASRQDMPPLEEGRYYITDLLGAEVADEKGNNLGMLCDILQHGAADVYVMNARGKTVMFPALKKLLKSVDVQNKVITVDAEVFSEVAVYD